MEKILFCCQKILGKFDLGVTSEKKTDDLKTFVKLVLTPPTSPYLILDIFILDKYKLIFTPPPPT